MADPTHVMEVLSTILTEIQTDSGHEEPDIDADTVPLNLPDFDSQIWPVAIGMIATELGIEIPNDVNIFVAEEDNNRKRTIREIITIINQYAEAAGTAS